MHTMGDNESFCKRTAIYAYSRKAVKYEKDKFLNKLTFRILPELKVGLRTLRACFQWSSSKADTA